MALENSRKNTPLARILLLLVIIFVLYLLFRGFFRSQAGKRPPPASGELGEDMVACSRCGVNQPRSETRDLEGQLVCANNPRCH